MMAFGRRKKDRDSGTGGTAGQGDEQGISGEVAAAPADGVQSGGESEADSGTVSKVDFEEGVKRPATRELRS